MMNQGGGTDTVTSLEPNSLEQRVADSNQTSSYYPPSMAGSEAVSWTMYRAVNGSMENGGHPTPSFNHDQRAEAPSSNAHDGLNLPSTTSTSVTVPANAPQEYSGYAAYPSTDPHGYGNTGYAGYYSGYQQQSNQPYQQQSNQSYQQPVGAYQSTGAPHQPLSSFQNTGSYTGTQNYSTTYYNPGDYQTSGGYTTGSYTNQANSWQQGSYGNYTANQYPNYTPESNGAYSSTSAPANSLQYQQQYKQWADYYSQTEVSCAPGTENISATTTSNPGGSVPGVVSSYSASTSQPTATFAPSPWRPESASSELPSAQPSAVINNVQDGYWKHGNQSSQNYQVSPVQPYYHNPSDLKPTFGSFQDQQKSEYSQVPNVHYPAHQVAQSYQSSLPVAPEYSPVPNVHYPAHQVAQSYHSSLPAAPPNAVPIDSGRLNNVQIPTNPRIVSNLSLGTPKNAKDNTTTSAAAKPAYIGVSLPKTNDKASSQVTTDSVLKPGMFPNSLRGYVERALARCKDDTQRTACQAVLKEVITKATADGTLCTRDWDIEPLFPIPNTDTVNQETFTTTVSAFVRNRRSPSRRTKSRWEPVPEEKPSETKPMFTPSNVKYGGWLHFNERDKKLSAGKAENKENNLGYLKFSLSDPRPTNKDAFRPAKRQRANDGLSRASDGGSSSESDKEQSLTAYSAAAIALADSPDERKKRESRSKRFDKSHGNRAANNHYRPKAVGAGNLYARRETALVLSKSFEDGSSKAVEDIDWDALTVKGTCQEVEKRYLRLTSAPDPATVRPEEVLERALDMVQNSQKNYLYKCDQLKSIRQDLTVQHVRNELTVRVYETHARLAIEVGDLFEYNQCQSQLKTLYAQGIKGCHMEFSAYNLLCVILHSNNNRDLLSAMSRLTAEARKDEAVKHALDVRSAVTSGNYVLFFRLYKTAPNLNTCLMDLYVEKMRYAAVTSMSRSYRPTLPVPYIAQVLGFTSVLPTAKAHDEEDTDGFEECIEWLKTHGACLTEDNSGEMQLDAKASAASLFVPEPEDAVSHGDASLAVNDFMTRTTTTTTTTS